MQKNDRQIDLIWKIAVVIPCYRVKDKILKVLSAIGPEVSRIYVVDDLCPEYSGNHVENNCFDSRVVILRHTENIGVGGAVLTGYKRALSDDASIIVKIDGDGQMDPKLIPAFISPIIRGEADYCKGNRFYNLNSVGEMPSIRIIGNAALSFLSKFSTGYWHLFDPTNGYTAIHGDVAKLMPFDKISKRYFFETDILFRLSLLKALALDIPMDAVYEDEKSNLNIKNIFWEFLTKNIINTFKRIFYDYYLRDLSIASFELPLGVILISFGMIFGSYTWINASNNNSLTPAGTVMLAALPMIIGMNLLLSFVAHDISSIPKTALQNRLIRNIGL